MPIVIQPYREIHEQAVREFNQRLISAGADPNLVFFTYAQPRWLPRTEAGSIFQEYFVALEGDVVRGGYALKYQDFYFSDGLVRNVGYYHHPISEGIVNTTYAALGAMLLKDAMSRSPLLYCLGMNGYDQPLPRMLIRLGWAHCAVPFYFKIVHPSRFLREIEVLRTSRARRIALDFSAFTGVGWAAIKAMQGIRRIQGPRTSGFNAEIVPEFSDWADSLWHKAKHHYAMVAVRDAKALQTLFPASDTHFRRVRVRRGSQDVGWAVVGERLKSSRFGDMRVGSIVDCWAEPQHALPVIRAAADALKHLGMDLIVSNQSHRVWAESFEPAGFSTSASNFIFAAGKGLSTILQPFAENQHRLHFTRADGDGLPRNF